MARKNVTPATDNAGPAAPVATVPTAGAPAAAAPTPAAAAPVAAPTPVPVPKDIKNGVTRPKAGTVTGRVWDICDQQSINLKAWAPREGVIAQAKLESINEATASTQYGHWRKYNGLVAVRIKKPVEPVAAPVEAETPAPVEAETPTLETPTEPETPTPELYS